MKKETIVKNLIAHSQIAEISKECKKQNIKLILLKGAALIELFPEYSFNRDIEDIDVLIEEKNYKSFIEILKKLGYTRSKDDPNVMYCEGKLKIDIKTHLWYLSKKENTELINRATKLEDFYVLSTSDMLKHIMFHSYFEHGFLEEKWKSDIEILSSHLNIKSKLELPINNKILKFVLKSNFYYKGHILKFLVLPWQKKLVYLFKYFFPSKEFMKNRYNTKSFLVLPFFYLYRVLSTALKLFRIISSLLTCRFLKRCPEIT